MQDPGGLFFPEVQITQVIYLFLTLSTYGWNFCMPLFVVVVDYLFGLVWGF